MDEKILPGPFDRLPVELRLRILSFTHLGARGDYCNEHTYIYANNSRKLFKGDEREPDSRKLPMGLFMVSRQMYQDAFDVFYRESRFCLASSFSSTLDFLQDLPPKGLRLIRHLRLSASMADSELIIRNTWTGNSAKRWFLLLRYLSENCDLPNLSISISLKIVGRWCYNDSVREKYFRSAYHYYRFITSMLCMLKDLKDVHFDLVWAQNLGPWMKREILGNKFRGEIHESGSSEDPKECGATGVPYWHQNDDRVQGSNFVPEIFVNTNV